MSGAARAYSRREALGLAAGAAGLAGAALLGGCGRQADERGFDAETHARAGYASDTEVKDYPVTLRLLVDANIEWMRAGLGDGGRLDYYMEQYRQQPDRGQVDFDVSYVGPAELWDMAESGFPGADGLLCLDRTIVAGCEAGTVDGGAGMYMVRDMAYNFNEHCVLVRAAGSDMDLPPAATLSGEDTPDGQINRFQQLPAFDGLVAVADPTATEEGFSANNMLAHAGLYEGLLYGGGSYDAALAEKLVFFASQDEAMASLASGECQLGFALSTHLNAGRYPDVEHVYSPQGGMVQYKAAAAAGAAEPGVARDLFEYILGFTF